MSSVVEINKTRNQAQFDYDVSKIFVNNNRYERGEFVNNTGATASFAAGTVLGRIAVSNQLAVLDSTATDGSQFPVGILLTPLTDLLDTNAENVNFCTSGDVVKDKILLSGSDTLETVIALKTIEDRIGSDTIGVILVDSDELTGFDNQ